MHNLFYPSINAGKKEKDPNESLNKSQDEGKPSGDGDEAGKGGLFKRVSIQSPNLLSA